MQGKQIHVLAGDRGGWNALEPVLNLALSAGCKVEVYFTATCADQFKSGKLTPDIRCQVSDHINYQSLKEFFSGDHHLTVLGASQSKEGTEAAVQALQHSKSPQLAVEDMYGSLMPTLKQVFSTKIDRICVIDQFARELILKELPWRDKKIVVTGGPQFDKVVEMKKTWQERRTILRNALQVNDHQPVFLIVGGLNGTVEILWLLESAINEAGFVDQAKVVLRIHPRSTDEDKRLVAEYMDNPFRMNWFTDVDRSLAPTSDDLLPAADFVLSGYSTTNHNAILCEMPGTVYVGTPAFNKDLKAEKNLDCPPEVDAGAAWYVQSNAKYMASIITVVKHQLFEDGLGDIIATQKRIASINDGQAADRVWQEMKNLMA